MKEILMIVFICSFTAALFGLMHFRRRYFLLYQNVQKFVKNILDGEEIPSHIPAEGDETVIQDLFIRISKKYNKETLAAMKEKEVIQGLISDLSHQLKTPLSNIRLYQDLLKSSSLSLQKKMQLEKRLYEQTDKLEWLLNALFQMVDLERGIISLTPDNGSILDTLQKAVETVLPKADQKEISFEMTPFPQCPVLHDPRWTEEVFINLLDNAVKYAPGKSTVHLSFEVYETYGAVRIQDQGPAISKEEYHRIFQKFYRGNSSAGKEGWGIGLYLSRLILEKEQGYITVDSKEGEGNTFSVFLPILTKL